MRRRGGRALLLTSGPTPFDVIYSVSSAHHESSDHFGHVAVERRRSHRENVVAIGRLTSIADQTLPSLKVLVTDVSLHGCDFRCDVAPVDGAIYKIELNLGPLSMTSRLRVTRLRLRPDSTYELGGEFV
jgi:hypothetical protein